jgi:phosphoserine phosphatase
MRSAGVRVVLVSGGLRPAIEPLATHLGIGTADLHAVDLRFDDAGAYVGYDESSPLATSVGKRFLVEGLDLPRPVLAMGDGATDAVMRGVVDRFAAYTGFARRENVVSQADVVIESFLQLGALVLGS